MSGAQQLAREEQEIVDGSAAEGSRKPRGLRRWGSAITKRVALLVAILIILRLTGCMEGLFYHPLAEPTPPPAGIEGVWFDSADGTRLYGWWVPAKRSSDAPGRAPTILHVHGNAGNIRYHEDFSACFAAGGMNVFLFDYRGFGQSEGASKRRGPLIEDAQAALDYVLTRGDVDPNRIGLYGQSLGGSIGITVMASRDEIRAAVLESPFDSWRRVAANAVGGDPPNPLARFLAWSLISDSDCPLNAIATIKRPVLIVHGTADRIIPVSHSRRLTEAAGNATLIEYEGGDHNDLQDTHPEVCGDMIAFLREHME